MRLLWWLATVVGVGFVSIVLSEAGAIDPARNLTLSVSAPVEDVFHDAASPLDDIYEGIADRGDLVRENEDLQEQVEALQAQLAAQQNLEQRLADLEAALAVKQSRPDDQLLAANVIAEEPSSIKRMVAIDRGSDDGLDEGMVVLSKSGTLVGTVAIVYGDYSWIRLVTDPESAVNAQVNATAVAAPSTTPSESALAQPPFHVFISAVCGVAFASDFCIARLRRRSPFSHGRPSGNVRGSNANALDPPSRSRASPLAEDIRL